ncbi:MAG: hypothetical protein ACRD1Y_07770 [Terriglobales bacterium]
MAAEKAVRITQPRRQQAGLREVRLLVPDTCLLWVRKRIATHIDRLPSCDEEDALRWVESVSAFDKPKRRGK